MPEPPWLDDSSKITSRGTPSVQLKAKRLSTASSGAVRPPESSVHIATEAQSQPADSTVSEYPEGLRLYIVFLALVLAVLIVGLDASVVATAIPRISDTFNSLDDVGWLYQLFSLKWTYLGAIGIFEIGSLIAALAQSSAVFIVGRAVSGLGFAGIGTGSLIIIAHAVPLQRRPMFTAAVGAVEGLGLILGPLVGGALTTHATWRWCFWINLPVGGIAALVIGFLLQPLTVRDASQRALWQKLQQFDWLGTAALAPSITCLLLALQWGGTRYNWSDARIIMLFVLFALLLAVFVLTQKYSTLTVTIPRRMARSRSMAFGALFAFSLSSALSVFSYYLPLWFQGIKGASAFQSGVDLLPIILGVLVGSLAGGSLVTLLGYYQPFMILSGALTAAGAGLFTTFIIETPKSKWIGYQALAGIGAGLGFQLPFIAAQTVLEKDDVAMGTSLLILSQTLAGAIFVSVGSTIFTNSFVHVVDEQVPQIDPRSVLESGATSLRLVIPAHLLDTVLMAYNFAITRTFYAAIAASGLAFFLALGMEFRSIKTANSSTTDPTPLQSEGTG